MKSPAAFFLALILIFLSQRTFACEPATLTTAPTGPNILVASDSSALYYAKLAASWEIHRVPFGTTADTLMALLPANLQVTHLLASDPTELYFTTTVIGGDGSTVINAIAKSGDMSDAIRVAASTMYIVDDLAVDDTYLYLLGSGSIFRTLKSGGSNEYLGQFFGSSIGVDSAHLYAIGNVTYEAPFALVELPKGGGLGRQIAPASGQLAVTDHYVWFQTAESGHAALARLDKQTNMATTVYEDQAVCNPSFCPFFGAIAATDDRALIGVYTGARGCGSGAVRVVDGWGASDVALGVPTGVAIGSGANDNELDFATAGCFLSSSVPTLARSCAELFPVIESVTPHHLVGLATVTIDIEGSGFDPAATVTIDGQPVSIVVQDASHIRLTFTPANAGTSALTIANPDHHTADTTLVIGNKRRQIVAR